MRLRLVVMFAFGSLVARGQGERAIHASTVPQFCSLDSLANAYYDSSSSASFLNLSPKIFDRDHVPVADSGTPRIRYTVFSIYNDGKNPVQFSFYPGPLRNVKVRLTLADGGEQEVLPGGDQHVFLMSKAIFLLSIPPGVACRYVVRCEGYGSPYKQGAGWLITGTRLDSFFAFYEGLFINDLVEFATMAGMLLMMLIYISAKYIQIKKPEYAYYAAYIGFLLLYVLLKTEEQIEAHLVVQLGPWFSFFNNQLQVCAYCMYFPFLTKFLDTKQAQPRLHRQLLLFPIGLLLYMVVDAALIRYNLFQVHDLIWNWLRLVLFIFVITISFRVYRMRHPYGIFPIIGGLSLDFFALASMIFSIHHEFIRTLPAPLNSKLLYYFLGIIIELLFFSLGLGYKNRRDEVEKVEALESLKLAQERQKFDHLRSVVEVQEKERARIAKDLHDGVGGLLSGISISLSNLKENLLLNQAQRLQYERSVDLLNGSVQELRRVAHDMMPASLPEFGFAAAVGDYCKAINSMKSVDVVFQVLGKEVRQDASREVVIYRIVQELINNILKHAQARQALVQLSFEPDQISITVEDDGEGFDYARESARGSGLSNIRSRVEYLKGVIDIESAPKKGSSFHIEVPIKMD